MWYLCLSAFRKSVKELGDVGHDGLLVRVLHIHVFRVNQAGDTQVNLGHVEGRLQPGVRVVKLFFSSSLKKLGC